MTFIIMPAVLNYMAGKTLFILIADTNIRVFFDAKVTKRCISNYRTGTPAKPGIYPDFSTGCPKSNILPQSHEEHKTRRSGLCAPAYGRLVF
jgi:hypothetical protein